MQLEFLSIQFKDGFIIGQTFIQWDQHGECTGDMSLTLSSSEEHSLRNHGTQDTTCAMIFIQDLIWNQRQPWSKVKTCMTKLLTNNCLIKIIGDILPQRIKINLFGKDSSTQTMQTLPQSPIYIKEELVIIITRLKLDSSLSLDMITVIILTEDGKKEIFII